MTLNSGFCSMKSLLKQFLGTYLFSCAEKSTSRVINLCQSQEHNTSISLNILKVTIKTAPRTILVNLVAMQFEFQLHLEMFEAVHAYGNKPICRIRLGIFGCLWLSSVIFGSIRLISRGHRFHECSITLPRVQVTSGKDYLMTDCRQYISLYSK